MGTRVFQIVVIGLVYNERIDRLRRFSSDMKRHTVPQRQLRLVYDSYVHLFSTFSISPAYTSTTISV